VSQALDALRLGQVLAYPTEAVYGLGCDPFNQHAVQRILSLKGRKVSKGLIVLIAEWPQLFALIGDLPLAMLDCVTETWPGPTTWIFPKSDSIPPWLSGDNDSIAIRMTGHPVARQLCQLGPIVSTSANPHGQEPARSLEALDQFFSEGLDGVVVGDLGKESQPSAIYDVLTGKRLR
jgi:L-threonylcarbamoyladenylate synthase